MLHSHANHFARIDAFRIRLIVGNRRRDIRHTADLSGFLTRAVEVRNHPRA